MKIHHLTTLVLSLALVGCSGTTGDSGDSGDDDQSSDSRETAPTTCPGGCPDGQYCFNGACVVGCNSNADCAEDQYCATDTDRLCHNEDVPECSGDSDCSDSQVCTEGLCAGELEQPDDECTPAADGKDGCGEYAVCVERDSGNVCRTLPRCSEDDTCPTGRAGAVCNRDYIPNKAEICLLGLCESDDDCPSDWSCRKDRGSQTLGFCWAGGGGETGSMCKTDEDCNSGNCERGPGSTWGVCS